MSFRFDEPHPATALWWAQREQCAQCENCAQGDGMLCVVTVIDGRVAWCIDARLEDQPCGPDARLFSPRNP